jgi:hypothetical protein
VPDVLLGLVGIYLACLGSDPLWVGDTCYPAADSPFFLVDKNSLIKNSFNFLIGGIEAQITCCSTCCLEVPQIITLPWKSPETGRHIWDCLCDGFLRSKQIM